MEEADLSLTFAGEERPVLLPHSPGAALPIPMTQTAHRSEANSGPLYTAIGITQPEFQKSTLQL